MRAWADYQTNRASVHYEHICPVEVLYKALLNARASSIKVSREIVHGILSEAEVVILSKQEARLLDGSKSKHYQVGGHSSTGLGLRKIGTAEERLEAIGARVEPCTSRNRISIAR